MYTSRVMCNYLSIYLSIYKLSIFHLSIYYYIYLSINLYMYCTCIYLHVYTCTYLSIYLSIYVSNLFTYPSILYSDIDDLYITLTYCDLFHISIGIYLLLLFNLTCILIYNYLIWRSYRTVSHKALELFSKFSVYFIFKFKGCITF